MGRGAEEICIGRGREPEAEGHGRAVEVREYRRRSPNGPLQRSVREDRDGPDASALGAFMLKKKLEN